MTEREKMISGRLYRASDAQLAEAARRASNLTRLFNDSSPDDEKFRENVLRELLGGAGKNLRIEPPFRCDYGSNIFVGNRFFANYDCIMLDVCPICVGDDVMLGPRVCIFTAAHPLDAGVRSEGLEYGAAVEIGNRVWIGGGAVINPGVKIGGDSVIGSGSVVTKDVPAGVVAAGNPCRVIRSLTDADAERWRRLRDEYYSS